MDFGMKLEAEKAATLIERYGKRVEVYAARSAIWQPVTARKYARKLRERARQEDADQYRVKILDDRMRVTRLTPTAPAS